MSDISLPFSHYSFTNSRPKLIRGDNKQDPKKLNFSPWYVTQVIKFGRSYWKRLLNLSPKWVNAASALFIFLVNFAFFKLLGTQSIKYLASDAPYYFAVAQRSFFPYFSFDGENATTGLHPLWQLLLLPISKGFQQPSLSYIAFVLAFCLLAIQVSLFNIYSILKGNYTHAAFIILFPSFWVIFAFFNFPMYGHTLSFANGMETSITICLLTFLLKSLHRFDDPRKISKHQVIELSTIIFLLGLARLDYIFISISLIVVFKFLAIFNTKQFYALISAAAAPPFIYGLYCFIVTGNFLPTSALMKSDSNNFTLNIKNLMSLINGGITDYRMELIYRHSQALAPMIFSLFFILINYSKLSQFNSKKNLKKRSSKISNIESVTKIVFGLAVGIFIRNLILYSGTSVWAQGHWYFPEGILFVSILFNVYLMRKFRKIVIFKSAKVSGVVALTILLTLIPIKLHSNYNANYIKLWNEKASLCKELGKIIGGNCSDLRMAEVDDGWVNYVLQAKTLNTFGLVADIEAVHKIKDNELMQLLEARCYRYYISSNYPMYGPNGMLGQTLPVGMRLIRLSSVKLVDAYGYDGCSAKLGQ